MLGCYTCSVVDGCLSSFCNWKALGTIREEKGISSLFGFRARRDMTLADEISSVFICCKFSIKKSYFHISTIEIKLDTKNEIRKWKIDIKKHIGTIQLYSTSVRSLRRPSNLLNNHNPITAHKYVYYIYSLIILSHKVGCFCKVLRTLPNSWRLCQISELIVAWTICSLNLPRVKMISSL